MKRLLIAESFVGIFSILLFCALPLMGVKTNIPSLAIPVIFGLLTIISIPFETLSISALLGWSASIIVFALKISNLVWWLPIKKGGLVVILMSIPALIFFAQGSFNCINYIKKVNASRPRALLSIFCLFQVVFWSTFAANFFIKSPL